MEYNLLSDELLVKLIRADDAGAFKEIYKRYWKVLFKSAQSKIGSDETAEELLQNVFLNVWEKRITTKIDNLGGYLFNSLKYQIVDHHRAMLLAERYTDFTRSREEEYELSPDEMVNFQDIIAIFEQVMRQLPEKTRRIFQHNRLEGKTAREISQILDMPERTVEYHITQSLKQLRMHLKEFLPTITTLFFWNL